MSTKSIASFTHAPLELVLYHRYRYVLSRKLMCALPFESRASETLSYPSDVSGAGDTFTWLVVHVRFAPRLLSRENVLDDAGALPTEPSWAETRTA